MVLQIAYYVSGHGYGHATRVSAFTSHLLTLPDAPAVQVHIVSTAPSHVFSDCIALGATYRYSEVDPVISQPVAYSVDRKQSLEVMRTFLDQRGWKLDVEVEWLKCTAINCVLSDAVFLACAAANLAELPCALITNFTFDSIWSWLANTLPDSRPLTQVSLTLPQPPNGPKMLNVQEDPYAPLAQADLEPLVNQIIQDYSCADLLYLLPGSIPIPSFSIEPAVPSTDWIDPITRRFRPKVLEILTGCRGLGQSPTLRPSIPFPLGKAKAFDRQIVPAPLIVRHPSSDVYSPSGRARILELVGIPKGNTSQILIVSFGGQKFKRPYSACPTPSTATPSTEQPSPEIMPQSDVDKLHHVTHLHLTPSTPTPAPRHSSHNFKPGSHSLRFPNTHPVLLRRNFSDPPRVATPTHIYIPGAPGPISNPNSPEHSARSPGANGDPRVRVHEPAPGPKLLPDGWIAVVCGAGADWGSEDLPSGFYIAPRDIYMPDLTAVGDVLLGKLGYGTVSECVDSCTPFIYVPRPAIIEEFGLRLLLESEGVGVEFTRQSYELGDWAGAVQMAWRRGELLKRMRRKTGEEGSRRRKAEGREMARRLVDWAQQW